MSLLCREAKLKLKRKKVDESDEQIAVLDGESDDEDEPDLSWLPDPDKIYGKSRSDGEDSSEDVGVEQASDFEDSEMERNSDIGEESDEEEPKPKR
jgi:ATP-dependent RNA helicase DDX10/DBP4